MADSIRFSPEAIHWLFADKVVFGKPRVENDALRRVLALQVKDSVLTVKEFEKSFSKVYKGWARLQTFDIPCMFRHMAQLQTNEGKRDALDTEREAKGFANNLKNIDLGIRNLIEITQCQRED